MRRHVSFGRSRPGRGVDLDGALSMLAPEFRRAVQATSASLTRAGIRHALVGGLAVGAHGYPTATKDVDFLVGDEAFVRHAGGVVTIRPEVPISIGSVVVDSVPAGDDPVLASALDHPEVSAGIPVAPVEVVVLMKLRVNRLRDRAHVAGLIASGADVEGIRRFLGQHDPETVDRFGNLVCEADAEESR